MRPDGYGEIMWNESCWFPLDNIIKQGEQSWGKCVLVYFHSSPYGEKLLLAQFSNRDREGHIVQITGYLCTVCVRGCS